MHLSRDAVLEGKGRDVVEVECPEWGWSVLVRGMTGKERDQFEVSLGGSPGAMQVQRGRAGGEPARDLVNLRAKVVVRCVVDEDGNRLFTDADVVALGEKSGAPVDRIFNVAARLSGMGGEDAETMTPNFAEAGPGEPSSSGSPAISARRPNGSSPRAAAASCPSGQRATRPS